MKQRSIDTMTPNKLAVYFVADMVLADMVVADIDFPCSRYCFFTVADIVLMWPIWFVADMVAPLHYNFRKLSFAARVVNVWNSLPDNVVDVNSLKQFETRLDKFWRDQDVMFDWTAEITGTGDRSEFKLETVLQSII